MMLSYNRQLFWFPIFVVLFEVTVYLSNDMYLPALPTLSDLFGVSDRVAQWTITAWEIGSAALLLFLGPLCVRFARGVLLFGGVSFILGTLVCVLGGSIETFLMGRFLQGSAVCHIMSAGYALVHEHFDTEKAVRLLAKMVSVTVIAPMAGPLLGGYLLHFYTWQVTFYFVLGLGVLSMVGMAISLPKQQAAADKVPFLKTFGHYKTLLQNPPFLLGSLTHGLFQAGLVAWITASGLVLLEYFDLKEQHFGWAQLPIFLGMLIGARLIGVSLKRRSIIQHVSGALRRGIPLGILLLALNFIFKAPLSYWVLCIAFYLMLCGLTMSPISRLTLMSAEAIPMGYKTACFYLVTRLAGALGSLASSLFYLGTLGSFAWILIVVLGGVLACHMGHFWYASKNI